MYEEIKIQTPISLMIRFDQTPFTPSSLTHFSTTQKPQIEALGTIPIIKNPPHQCKNPSFRFQQNHSFNLNTQKIKQIWEKSSTKSNTQIKKYTKFSENNTIPSMGKMNSNEHRFSVGVKFFSGFNEKRKPFTRKLKENATLTLESWSCVIWPLNSA